MRSLRWRFILPFVALLVVALGGLSAYLSSYIRDTYLNFQKTSLLRWFSMVVGSAEESARTVPSGWMMVMRAPMVRALFDTI